MISSSFGSQATLFSRFIVISWLSTLFTPVLLFIFPLQAMYMTVLLTASLLFTGLGLVGLRNDIAHIEAEENIDWEPTRAYYLGIIPLPTSFFILGFYLGFRDKAYGVFDVEKTDELSDQSFE
jgi:hypothetical protein